MFLRLIPQIVSRKTTAQKAILDRYLAFRRLSVEWHSEVIATLGKAGVIASAKRLGILEGKAIVLECEEESDILLDFAIYAYRDSKEVTAVQRWLRRKTPADATVEQELAAAMQKVRYRLVQLVRPVRGVGADAIDVQSREPLFVADVMLSKSAKPGVLLAAHFLPFADFHMTTGASIPLDPDTLETALKAMNRRRGGGHDPSAFAKHLIRAALQSGATSCVHYSSVSPK